MTDTTGGIPLVDIRAINAGLRASIDEAMRDVVESAAFINGPSVGEFEAAFASFCGTTHAVGVASGTAAIQLALAALDVRPGDEVATTPLTFVATAEAVSSVGARPRFVDVEETTGGMSPVALSAVIADVSAVLPVHLYGLPVDVDKLLDIAGDIPLVEDAAQAHGATVEVDGVVRRAGSVGRLAAFSFYPGKNLGAFGDAGAVTTAEDRLAERVRRLRDHGRSTKYLHEEIGFGHRLDSLQAAVLLVKLGYLEHANESRRRLAARYDAMLAGVGDLVLLNEPPGRVSARHLYVVRTRSRNELLSRLHEYSVGAGIHYPVPLHLQPAYRWLGHARGDFPVSEAWADTCLSLPLSEALTEHQQDRVVQLIREFFGEPL